MQNLLNEKMREQLLKIWKKKKKEKICDQFFNTFNNIKQ